MLKPKSIAEPPPPTKYTFALNDNNNETHNLLFHCISSSGDPSWKPLSYMAMCSHPNCPEPTTTHPFWVNDDTMHLYAQGHIDLVNQHIQRAKEEKEAIQHAYRIGFC